MSKIEVDAIDKQSGSTLTIGGSGTTVQLGSGASQTGFGRTGTVDWQTGSIKTGTFSATNGEGYFVNTAGSTATANLPAGSAGAIVAFADYNNNFATNKFTVSPNGSDKIGGENTAVDLTTSGQSVTLVFVDSTEGWVTVNDSSENIFKSPFIVATGGTTTNAPCGNFKIHTFTGPGTFTVNQVATTPANNEVSYVVVGAGGSGSANNYSGPHNAGAGGGAGGFREYKSSVDSYTASPLNGNPGGTAITVTAQAYPITVGGGGAAVSGNSCGNNGNTSTFSTVTSAGGGKGGKASTVGSGGSGGGGGRDSAQSGGAGNTPPTTPPQGNNGGNSVSGPYGGGGGGGGAGAVGGNGTSGGSAASEVGGPGGAGVATCITGSPVARAGGGGAYVYCKVATRGTGGSGGGGTGGYVSRCNGGAPCNAAGGDGTDNTGGGGGGGGQPSGGGGSGVVIIRYKIG